MKHTFSKGIELKKGVQSYIGKLIEKKLEGKGR